jgi:hypothetical protein
MNAVENFRVFFRLFTHKSLQTKKLKRILQTFLQTVLQTYFIQAQILILSPKTHVVNHSCSRSPSGKFMVMAGVPACSWAIIARCEIRSTT